MEIVRTVAELRAALRALPGSVGFAPTMGYLHRGHASLFEAAATENDVAVASIFVNPLQFGRGEDLATYPRDPERDTRLARQAGVHVLWMPSVDDLYPPGFSTRVRVEGLTEGLCGRSRPTHFEGVTTVVSRLFLCVRPDRAYFGRKDFQQLAVLSRMNDDLGFGITIRGMPIVREADGLAMSSRNVYLAPHERTHALALHRALRTTRAAWSDGVRDAATLRRGLEQALPGPDVRIDYAEVLEPTTLREPDGGVFTSRAVALVAAWVGSTRLLDNTVLGEPDPTLDAPGSLGR